MSTNQFHNMGLDEGAESLLDIHGETVTYKPSGGSDREIVAMVDRETPTAPSPSGMRSRPKTSIVVTVRDSTTLGISAGELDLGGDAIEMPIKVGQAATTRSIQKLISQEFGMLVLEVI